MNTLKPEFVESLDALSSLPGGETLRGLAEVLSTTDPSVSIRLNERKGAALVHPLRPVPWAHGGFHIDGERPRFTFDPALHQGLYYIQDASSMAIGAVVETLTRHSDPIVYIDACAAPGGKTTAAIDALPDGSLVIANEYDRRRIEALADNLLRWGYPATVVTSGDTAQFRRVGAVADIVALDVPCSGEGMMRKDADAAAQWSPALVTSTAALQRTIIDNLWEALRPGGYMIYSTCTFNNAENEDNLRYIVDTLGAQPVDIHPMLGSNPAIATQIDCPYPAARFIPGRIDGEGLFMAVVRKPGDRTPNPAYKPTRASAAAHPWLHPDFDGRLRTVGDTLTAIPAAWSALIDTLSKKLSIRSAGLALGTTKGRDLLPTYNLANSLALNLEAFPTHEVGYTDAIAYLRREAITLADAPRGIILLTYGSRPLGFVKNLGNRANNLLPQANAIRSTHLPDTPPHLVK